MSAHQVATTIEAAGGELFLMRGEVRIKAASPLPVELVAAARAVKAELLALVLTREGKVLCARCGLLMPEVRLRLSDQCTACSAGVDRRRPLAEGTALS